MCLAGLTLACTQPDLRGRSVQGIAVLAATPHTAPAEGYFDSSAPGSGDVGVVRMTNNSIGPIRDALTGMFSLPLATYGNLAILYNPTAATLQALGSVQCTPGKRHACLIVRTAGTTSEHNPLGVFISPWEDEFSPLVYQNLVELPSNNPHDPRALLPLRPHLLAVVSLDLTSPGLALLDDAVPLAGPAQTWCAGDPEQFTQSTRDDVVLPLTILPEQTRVATLAGKHGDPGGTGLWFTARLDFPGFARDNSCNCQTACYTMQPQSCVESCQNVLIGTTVESHIRLNSATIHLGLVPQTRPGCDATKVADADRFRTNPGEGWMRNFPGGLEFRQDCLDVFPVVLVDMPIYRGTECPWNGGCIDVHVGGLDPDGHAWCSIADCDGIATDAAASNMTERVETSLIASLYEQLGPVFNYQAYPGSLLYAEPVPPDHLGCPLADLGCLASIQADFLPASIRYMTYSWFASAFGPPPGEPPHHQFPIWKIDPGCPPGAKQVTPAIVDQGDLPVNACVACPAGLVWNDECPYRCSYYPEDVCSTDEDTNQSFDADEVPALVEFRYLLDPDTDLAPATTDNCPFDANQDQKNSDWDALGDACDNCPGVPNDDQRDDDGNGLGHACDPCDDSVEGDVDGDGEADDCVYDECPCNPAWLPHDNDSHCDYCDGTLSEFCRSFCGSFDLVRLDNCPTADNDDQRNCNQDAERVNHAAILGDVCDPTPCPQFTPLYEGEGTLVELKAGTTQGVAWTRTVRYVPMSSIDLTPIGLHGAEDTDYVAQEVEVIPSRTEYRYCVDLENPLIQCDSDDYVATSFLTTPAAKRSQEQVDSIWHRITIKGLASPNVEPNPADLKLAYSTSHAYSRQWDFPADFKVWAAAPPAVGGWGYGQLPSLPSEPGQGKGRLWIHGDSSLGMTLNAVGLHPLENPTMAEQDPTMLVSHYQSAEPVTLDEGVWTKTLPITTVAPFYARFCPECPKRGLDVDDCTQCGAIVNKLDQRSIYELQPLIVLGEGMPAKTGVLNHDGTLIPVDSKLGPALLSSLTSSFRWVGQAEASPSIGRASRSPIAVALSADGTMMVDRAWMSGHRVLADGDMLDRIPGGQLSVVSLSNGSLQSPEPRVDFQATLSGARGQLFLVGGKDPTTGAPKGDIWVRDAAMGGPWYRVQSLDFTPQDVLAATFSYRDGRLWILDEIRSHGMRFARLTRVDPRTGASEVLGQWPRLKLFDQHWLVLDRDGSVLLAASSSKVNKHIIVRFDNGATPVTIDGVRIGPKELVAAPGVDVDGYSLIVRHSNKQVRVERLSSLEARPGRWLDVGACF